MTPKKEEATQAVFNVPGSYVDAMLSKGFQLVAEPRATDTATTKELAAMRYFGMVRVP